MTSVTRIDTLPEQHALALSLLAGRHPGPEVVALLAALPPEVTPLLWHDGDGGDAPDPQQLLDAAWRLRRWPAGEPADKLASAITCLGGAWRHMPVGLLYKLAEHLQRDGMDAGLTRAEARHLARWGAVRCPQFTVSAARRLSWAELTDRALRWRADDEISLRRDPERRWVCPLAGLTVCGVRVQPLTQVSQLLAAGHDGALMHVATVQAMEAGLQAWFLLRSRFRVPGGVDACCALEREPGGAWTAGPVYAPPACRALAEQVARSLLAQAQLADRTAARARSCGSGAASAATLNLLSAALRGTTTQASRQEQA